MNSRATAKHSFLAAMAMNSYAMYRHGQRGLTVQRRSRTGLGRGEAKQGTVSLRRSDSRRGNATAWHGVAEQRHSLA